MHPSRREFLDRLALGATAGAAALGGLPLTLGAAPAPLDRFRSAPGDAKWDLKWTSRLTGKHRVVFDVPEVESGYGVWRASIWANQYHDVLGIPTSDMSTVVVLRHNAIVLALQQSFWDDYGIGKSKSVTHPVTQEATDRNPVLLASSRKEIPADFDAFALDRLIARGAVVLACNLALRDCVALIQKREGLDAAAAHDRAVSLLVPGVILQPSGVFAALYAQDAGCRYLRAS